MYSWDGGVCRLGIRDCGFYIFILQIENSENGQKRKQQKENNKLFRQSLMASNPHSDFFLDFWDM